MAKNTGAREESTKARGLRGKVLPTAIVVAAKSATLVGVVFAFYLIAFFAAVRVVPLVMSFVASGTGVTTEMPMQTIIAAWIAPSVFLIALLFVLVLVTMRAIWTLRTKAVAAITAWAFGFERVEVAATPAGRSKLRPSIA